MQEARKKETIVRRREQSPVALFAVIALHVVVLALLLHYQPRLSAAMSQVLHVSMITLPEPLPVEEPPAPPQPKIKPTKKTITPPPPLESPSATAISEPPAPPAPVAPPEPAPVVATTPAVPTAPLVLPRFDADYLRNPPPVYPVLSRRNREQGRVMLRVVVAPDGSPQSVELRTSSGAQRLDDAALEAVRRWRFVPARMGSTPVTAAVIVPIVFSLEG